MKRIKNIVSFLYPLMIEARNGKVTPYLEVMQSKGKYVLNSENANYSFDGLHLIFDKLFQKIDINKFEFKNVLILGMGAGSIISLLRNKYNINCPITAIEKDEVVIELAKKYFNIDKYESLTIKKTDAFDYVLTTDVKYDLIISDLFVDNDVPKIFASRAYLKNLKRISSECSCIMYNKMTESAIHKKELQETFKEFEYIFPGTVVHKFNVYNSENSVLYYNTLPISIKQNKIFQIVNSNNEIEWSNLNPTYSYDEKNN
jgi:spermidine synthase